MHGLETFLNRPLYLNHHPKLHTPKELFAAKFLALWGRVARPGWTRRCCFFGDAAKGGKCAGKVEVCCFTSARSWPELEVQGFGDSGIWQQCRSAGLRQLRVSLLGAGFDRHSPDWVGYQKQRLVT